MSENRHEEVGSLTGVAAGALAGASLGSMVLPVVGTFAGALVGGILGSEVGRTVGGTVLNMIDPSGAGPRSAPEEGADVIAQLERLGALKTQGLITEEEFKAAKAKLLGL